MQNLGDFTQLLTLIANVSGNSHDIQKFGRAIRSKFGAILTTFDFDCKYIWNRSTTKIWKAHDQQQPLQRLAKTVGELWFTNKKLWGSSWSTHVDFFGRLHFGP